MKKIFDFIGSIGKDKVIHFTICLVVTLLVGGILKACGVDKSGIFAGAWVAGFVVGIGKEIYDEWKYKGADEKDWLADILGIVLGMIILLILIL